MSENTTVFPGRAEDVPAILEIQKACGLSAWTEGGYLAEVGRADSILLVSGIKDADVVGFIVGRILPTFGSDLERESEIYNIGALPDFRSRGIGSGLITRFIELCEARYVSRVWLEVRASNSIAKSFYRKHGFIHESTRTAFYANPVEDADVMYKPLDTPSRG